MTKNLIKYEGFATVGQFECVAIFHNFELEDCNGTDWIEDESSEALVGKTVAIFRVDASHAEYAFIELSDDEICSNCRGASTVMVGDDVDGCPDCGSGLTREAEARVLAILESYE